jgi:GT2 family glycosyltransferase
VRTLASFRNVHCDDRIVVCGCGSSLNDFKQPERFVTIGVNDVGRLLQPTYLLVVDPRERFKGDRFHYVETSKADYLFTQIDNLGVTHPNIVKVRLGDKGGTGFNDPNVLHYSVVTPYMALYLAALMGSKLIGIIGVDFTDHHFFGQTGTHEWTPFLATIDRDFRHLAAALVARGIKVFNLSAASRVAAFPKMSLDEFAKQPILPAVKTSSKPLRIVSYATTPVAGVPAILTRCINARTRHHSRSIWATGDYGNGVVYDGDLSWNQAETTSEELASADVVIAHNGKVDAQHRHLLADKAVLTMAHNYIWNVDQNFVRQGFPGVVLGQYQSTLPEFNGWLTVPNPMPLWESAFRPGNKDKAVTICYTPSGKHDQYPKDHRLYWHSKGYDTTMRILESLDSRYALQLEVVRDKQVSHAEALAMKRRSHILIDECVTGSYHRNSLEGLATGCVVVNGVGLLPEVLEALRRLIGRDDCSPFTFASLESLERTLTTLIERGPESLAEQGAANRLWVERHWNFASQWDQFWQPAVSLAMERRKGAAKTAALPKRTVSNQQPPSISVVIASLNEGEYLRRTVENLMISLPHDSEIIVVDDGSVDGSTDSLKKHGDRVVLLGSAERLGSACARNFGAAHASGEILVFCDAHVATSAAWAPPLLAALRQPEVGAVSPAIRVMRYPDDYTSTGVSKEAKGYGLRWRDAALGVAWLPCKTSKPYPVPLLNAAFMALRRNVFAATGGFDPKQAIWGTEEEFSYRLWTLGFECLVVPEVEVAHRFRHERPYCVDWESVLYNKMRLASVHFSPERIQRVAETLKRNPAFAGVVSRLAAAETENRRANLHSLRRYDDDWFFLRFRSELNCELTTLCENELSQPAIKPLAGVAT